MYTTKQAVNTLDSYLKLDQGAKKVIDNTKERGFVFRLNSGEKVVIFVYPLVHKQDNTKNYFDTRDSGAYERGVTWGYAINHEFKYFCLGVNIQVEKYKNYVFSLECDEKIIEKISGTKEGNRNGPGNQIIIPNDYIPNKKFERIRNRLGIYIAVIHTDVLLDYLEKYDNRPYTMDDNFEDKKFSTDINKYQWISNIKYGRNRIVFGAPGTGKSYRLKKDSEELIKENSANIERVTFYPDYTYAKFVGTYKPVSDINGDIRYKFVPGPFMRIYVEALRSGRTDNPQPFLLIVEELNRARAASVFGDIFQLLDRDADGVSEYEIQATEDIRNYLAEELGGTSENYPKLQLPNNMFIWATMNSADQGVFPMDTAFKRRWEFEYIGIDDSEDKVEDVVIPVGMRENRKYFKWNLIRKGINKILTEECKINEDKLLGPFFLSNQLLFEAVEDSEKEDKFVKAFESKVIMYLFEDVMKMKPSLIFKGHAKRSGEMIYSEICNAFEKEGIEIFDLDLEISDTKDIS